MLSQLLLHGIKHLVALGRHVIHLHELARAAGLVAGELLDIGLDQFVDVGAEAVGDGALQREGVRLRLDHG